MLIVTVKNCMQFSQLQSAVDSNIMNVIVSVDPTILRTLIQEGLDHFEAINITDLGLAGNLTFDCCNFIVSTVGAN